jgi:3-oxoacyl-[acyl-carrier-protein] synthase-1
MSSIYISSNNIISSLGFNTKENIHKIKKGISGIKFHRNFGYMYEYTAKVENKILNEKFSKIGANKDYTKLEKMMILSLNDTISKSPFSITKDTALIISTTKGNIDMLGSKNSKLHSDRVYLTKLGEVVKKFFKFYNDPIIICNACVSGVLGITVAKKLIKNKNYKDAFVVAGDIVSNFTLSGFKSLQAISNKPCSPYSKNRNGISLGEAAVSVAISSKINSKNIAEIIGEGESNDANHISGPSRNGEGLFKSINKALNMACLSGNEIEYICAHGTATVYNDEMEAQAFNRLNMQDIPLNSLKGYFGHTLGAAGLLETIIATKSMNNNYLYKSYGFNKIGLTLPLNIIKKNQKKNLSIILKTASGFGGSNVAILIKKCKN